MISTALRHNGKISVSTSLGTRMIGNKLIDGRAGTTTVCRQDITEIEDGVLPDDCTVDEAKDVLADYVLAGDLTDAEIEAILALYPAWKADKLYKPADGLLRHAGKLYQINQEHTSQAHFPPSASGVTALYSEAVPESVIAAWRQPEGSHDAYADGALVTHDNPNDGGTIWVYESTYDGNTTEPGRDGTYDRYWTPIERA